MNRLCWSFGLLLLALIGCAGPNFTHLGNGVGVPSESIDAYAEENQVSREEAVEALRQQLEHGSSRH